MVVGSIDINKMKYEKVYVEMLIKVRQDGEVRPVRMTWKNGKKYMIDKVKFITPAASLKVGGRGIRYTVIIGGKERFLFEEDGKWFVEAECMGG